MTLRQPEFRQQRFRPRCINQKGFTLLEVMVAIAIFAVIGLGCSQVLDRVITTKTQIEERSAQLRQLQRGVWLLARDIRSIVDRPVRNTIGEQEHAVTSLVAGYPLLLTRNGWANPLGEKRSTQQRVGYVVEPTEEGNNALVRYYWSVLDQAPNSEPRRQVLLENINYFEVQFIDTQGNQEFHWPPNTDTTNDTDIQPTGTIPAGILIRMNVAPYGEIERLFSIRNMDRES